MKIRAGGECESTSSKLSVLHHRTKCGSGGSAWSTLGCAFSTQSLTACGSHQCWVCWHCWPCQRGQPGRGLLFALLLLPSAKFVNTNGHSFCFLFPASLFLSSPNWFQWGHLLLLLHDGNLSLLCNAITNAVSPSERPILQLSRIWGCAVSMEKFRAADLMICVLCQGLNLHSRQRYWLCMSLSAPLNSVWCQFS